MAIFEVQAPDGKIVQIEAPDGATEDQVMSYAQEMYKPAEKTTGFTGAVGSSYEKLKGEAALTAGKVGLMDKGEAEKYNKEQEQKADRFKPTEEGWLDAPWQNFKETLGGSLPYMAAPIVVGGAGAALASAALAGAAPAVLGGTVLGAGLGTLGAFGAGAAQFTGSNLSRQMQEGKSYEEADIAKAALAALPQAALDTLSLHMIPGVSRIFGKAGVKITEDQARKLAEQGLMASAGSWALKTGKTMGSEGGTEAAQQVFERLQAGLDITDEKARKEYFDNFIGGAVLGGVLGGFGHFISKPEVERAPPPPQNEQAPPPDAQEAPQQTLALPAPSEPYSEPDPSAHFQNPLGMFARDDGTLTPEEIAHVDKLRENLGKPPLPEKYSIEDVADVIREDPAGLVNTGRGILERMVISKTGNGGDAKITPATIIAAAAEKNVDVRTAGFRDFLRRTVGTENLNALTSPQLAAVHDVLQKAPKNAEQLVLPQGTNATHHTEDQYKEGVTALTEAASSEEKELTHKDAIEAVKSATGLKDDADANRIIDKAVSENKVDRSTQGNGEEATYTKSAPAPARPENKVDVRREKFKRTDANGKAVIEDKHVLYEDGKPVARFDNPHTAEKAGLMRMEESQLNDIIAHGNRPDSTLPNKRHAILAEQELNNRKNPSQGMPVETSQGVEGGNERISKTGSQFNYRDIVKENIEGLVKSLHAHLDRYGLNGIVLKIVDSLKGGQAEGSYAKALITIAMRAGNEDVDPWSVIRHEAIHALKELGAFTPKEWATLQKMAQKKWIKEFIGDDKVNDYKEVYEAHHGNLNGFDEYIAEEAIAEAFRYFSQNKPPAGFIANLMRRLGEMFKGIRKAFGDNGFKSADEIFQGIEEGQYKGDTEQIDQMVAGHPKYALPREYGLDLKKKKRVMAQNVEITQKEIDDVNAEGVKLGLPQEEIDRVVKKIEVDKKRYPLSRGWAHITATGIVVEKDDNNNPIIGKSEPRYQSIPYGYDKPPGINRSPDHVDIAWRNKVASKFQSMIEDIYKRAAAGDENAKRIVSHASWYKGVAKALRIEYGGFGDMLADLIGATSPQTTVNTNWRFSLDVMKQFMEGKFNRELEAFSKYLETGAPINKYPNADKIRQISGKLYGINSVNAMKALSSLWRIIEPKSSPKAKNFALNLIGQSNMATIDVWAARMLRRAARMLDPERFNRIPPPAEQGVTGKWNNDATSTTLEYAFGASVMDRVSERLKKKGIDIDPPDLQAVAWFAEKELWGTNQWTNKAGEEGSVEKEMEYNPASRWTVGHSIQEGDVAPSDSAVANTQGRIIHVFKSTPHIRAFRIMDTKGLYGESVERAFDTEFVTSKGFDPSPIVAAVAQEGQHHNQIDVFISNVIPPKEGNPNARPGVEIYFRNRKDMENIMPILNKFTSRGQDGFTLAVDPRTSKNDEYIGVRLQYVPEISMRWDDKLRDKLADPVALKKIVQKKRRDLSRAIFHMMKDPAVAEGIANAGLVNYDTLVMGQENYHEYVGATSQAGNRASGIPWFGQSVYRHVAAAAKRYQQAEGGDSSSVANTGSPEKFALYRYNPSESPKIVFRPSEHSGSGITFQHKRPDAKSVYGTHYGTTAGLTHLAADKYGTGLKGEEAKRLAYAKDDRIKRRVYFYTQRFNGTMPYREQGVGSHVYTQKLDNILAPGETMSRLNKESKGDNNAFESAVLDAGYDGYVNPDYGIAVVLGNSVPVEYEGAIGDILAGKEPQKEAPKYSLTQTKTPEFKHWFGNSVVKNEDGTPKVMYHGTSRNITKFRPQQGGAIFVTEDPLFADFFNDQSEDWMIRDYWKNQMSAEEKDKMVLEAAQKAWYDNGFPSQAAYNRFKKSVKDKSIDMDSIPPEVETEVRDLVGGKLEALRNTLAVYVRAENPFNFDDPEHQKALYKKLLEYYKSDQVNLNNWKPVNGEQPTAEMLASRVMKPIVWGDWRTIESDVAQNAIKALGHDGYYVSEQGRKNLAVYDPNQIKSATGNHGAFSREDNDIRYAMARTTKTTKGMSPTEKVRDTIEQTLGVFKDGSVWTDARVRWIDPSSALAKTLSSLPLFDQNGFLRADMLNHSKAHSINLIRNGLLSGVPVVSNDGTIIIKDGASLAETLHMADKLDNNPHVKAADSAFTKGLKGGRDYVAEIARILRGEDIINEDAKLKASGTAKSIRAAKLRKDAVTAFKKGDLQEYKRLRKEATKLVNEGRKERKSNREKKVDATQIAWAHEQLIKVPEVQKILDVWKEINTALVTLWEHTGILSKAKADEFRANKNYVPLFKSAEDLDLDEHFIGSGKGLKSAAKTMALEGGLQDVNIWENLNTQYAKMTAAAYENQTRRVAVDQLESMGRDAAYTVSNPNDPKINLRYKHDGKIVHAVVGNPNDLAAFQMMTYQLSPIMKAFSGATKVLRMGALINPMFWIKQLVRDSIHGALVSDTGITTPLHSAKEFIAILMKNSPEARVLERHGVFGQYDSTLSLGEYLENVGKTTIKPSGFDKLFHKIMAIHEASDAATRVAIYKKAYAEGISKGFNPKQAEDYGVFKARESINFAVHGTSPTLNTLRHMIPFLSAQITSLDTVYRAMTGHNLNPEEKARAKKIFMTRAAMFMAMTAAYALMYQDDEEYKKLPDYVRDGNWLIPVTDSDGKKTFLKVPVPFEIGFLLKTIPEAAIRMMYNNSTGKEVLASYVSGIKQNMPAGGIPLPQAVKPLIESATGYSFFSGRPIESRSDQGLPVSERGQRASETAHMASRAGLDKLGLSPAKIDNLVTGYFAEMGTLFMQTAGAAVSDKNAPALNDEQKYFIKSFMADPHVTKAVSDFYNIDNEAREISQAFNHYKSIGLVDEARRIADTPEKQRLIQAAPAIRKMGEQLGMIRKQMEAVRGDPKLTPEEKRVTLNRLNDMFNMGAERAYGQIKGAGIEKSFSLQ